MQHKQNTCLFRCKTDKLRFVITKRISITYRITNRDNITSVAELSENIIPFNTETNDHISYIPAKITHHCFLI